MEIHILKSEPDYSIGNFCGISLAPVHWHQVIPDLAHFELVSRKVHAGKPNKSLIKLTDLIFALKFKEFWLFHFAG